MPDWERRRARSRPEGPAPTIRIVWRGIFSFMDGGVFEGLECELGGLGGRMGK